MNRLEKSCVRSAALVAVIMFSCSLALAIEGSDIAEATIAPEAISWRPAVRYESAVLTVSGPGDLSLRREFTASEALAFYVDGENLGELEDGQYAWELRFAPVTDAKAKKALREGRESGDTSEIDVLREEGRLPLAPLATSGYFTIKDGWIVTEEYGAGYRRGERKGGPAQTVQSADPSGIVDRDGGGLFTKDQLIYDDLIVTGSECVGFDCVNGENFGFDTIILKENNLRIFFNDTSSTASYPSNDWRITVNDSTNGGANKFSIDDASHGRTPFTIEANAPSNSLYIEDYGRVGFGTSTPSVEAHIKDSDTPTVRLEQDSSGGWTAQTWDLAGNESNFFIRDVTNGSKLPFRIQPSTPSSTMCLKSDGNVGIGTWSPEGPLHISRTGHVIPIIQSTDNNAVQLRFKTTSSNRRIIGLDASGVQQSQIVLGDGGEIQFLGATAGDLNAVIDNSGLHVNGTITLNGTQIHPDYVFSPSYRLETISEHAEYMWTKKHLPAVGAQSLNSAGEPVLDVGTKTLGILEELEKAHIYIEQLHKQIEALERRLSVLERRDD